MVRVVDLRARVASRYAELDLPAWPDPHPGRSAPSADEYSRLTSPERYRITHARAQVWTAVLASVPGVTVERLAAPRRDRVSHQDRFDRGVRLTSSGPGTVPLLLLERDVVGSAGDAPLAVLQISVGRPAMPVDAWPDCGCDACDSGSQDLLDALDESVARVVSGPLVVLHGPDWYAQWHPDGGSSGGVGRGPDHAEVMDLCRRLADGRQVRLPRGVRAVVGRGWLGAR